MLRQLSKLSNDRHGSANGIREIFREPVAVIRSHKTMAAKWTKRVAGAAILVGRIYVAAIRELALTVRRVDV